MLALSHEETVTFHVAQAVRSYRQLPMLLYHFQTKGRDEARPRAGVLRTREFIMKDAYSFDRDDEGLQASYEKFIDAYDRICDRVGLEWYRVESDVGMMGGSGAHEYMAPCPAGENDVALAPGYAANTEVASADPQPVRGRWTSRASCTRPEPRRSPRWSTPLGVQAGNVLKAYPVVTESRGLVMAFVRGDHRVNDDQARQRARRALPARPRGRAARAPAASSGPTPDVADAVRRRDRGRPGLRDRRQPARLPPAWSPSTAASAATCAPSRSATRSTATRSASSPRSRSATSSSSARATPSRSDATYLDENGKEQLIVMGSYGIGPARITAAAIEQYADEQGISWPRAIAPWDVEIVAIGKPGTPERDAAEALYAELSEAGLKVLLDDRDAGPGREVRRCRAARRARCA